MNLLIDWGNTQLKCMLVEDLNPVIKLSAELSTTAFASVEELLSWLDSQANSEHLDNVLIASVRKDQQTEKLAQVFNARCKRCFIAKTTSESAGVSCAYKDPNKLGIDRWLAVVAGFSQFKASVIIDIGSAITVDVVDCNGLHLGGHIIPGIKLIKNSLKSTDKVFAEKQLDETQGFKLGHSTGECVDFGIQQLIEGYLKSVISELASNHNLDKWIFTGGGGAYWLTRLQSANVLSASENSSYLPNIVFSGLVIDFLEKSQKPE